MAIKKSSSRKTSTTPWGWIAAALLFIALVMSNLTGVKVNTVRGDLAEVQAKLEATATEAPATEAPAAATEAPAEAEALVATEEAVAEAPDQPEPPQMTAADLRNQHLLSLQPSYESGGWEVWLRTAGINFDSSKVESRQPVEEVILGNVTVTGLVIRATGLEVSWPSCITTDRPNEVTTSASTRQHQPDLRNPSVLYTNAVLNGQATVYADCSDWGQLDPTK